jgi:hypothetical protein
MAGMIDGLQGLGQKLLSEGFSTPLLNIPLTFMLPDLDGAIETLARVRKDIERGNF